MRHLLVLLAFGVGSLFSITSASRPSVTIQNGTVIGYTKDGIDSFLDLPYVKPPVGDLRLRRPQHIDEPFGTLTLHQNLLDCAACVPQNTSSVNTTGLTQESIEPIDAVSMNFTGTFSEDCLSINVQRPSDLKPGTKLPVLFWIYGGAFAAGNTQTYDGTGLVTMSIGMKQPVIFVAANYRINAFGFLHGKELQQEGNTNLGLRDQRKALEWVAENIAAFGGDPDRVTLWGESAGAISVFDHLLINKGDNKYKGRSLFHGAIMNSGSILRAVPTSSEKAQTIFDTVAAAAGCGMANDTLACMRQAPYMKLVPALNAVPNNMGVHGNDFAYLPRPDPVDDFFSVSPEVAVAEGWFAHVPFITGNQQDESAIFSIVQRDFINSTDTLVDYIGSWLPEASRDIVAGLVDTYPNEAEAGLPADTGLKNELYPQFKRLVAVQSDLTFIMARREALSHMVPKVSAWSFLSTYLHDRVPYLGTYHSSDVETQFTLITNKIAGQTMDAAYINFVNHLDPNGKDSVWWPKWDEKHLRMVNVSATEVTVIKDDFRWKSYEYSREHSTHLRQ